MLPAFKAVLSDGLNYQATSRLAAVCRLSLSFKFRLYVVVVLMFASIKQSSICCALDCPPGGLFGLNTFHLL